MKRSILTPLILAVAAFSAFAFGHALSGNGALTTETRKATGFSAVDMSGVGSLRLRRGPTHSVRVTLDENLQGAYESRVERGTLVLGFKNFTTVNHLTKLVVEVTLPSLEGISLSGAAEAELVDAFSGDRLEYSSSGASSLSGAIDYDELEIDVSGGGRTALSGRAGEAVVKLSGASRLEGDRLATAVSRLGISGASSVTIRASDRLEGSASGASTVRYFGKPRFSVGTSGASSVTRAGD